jgi:hypothetical protein
MRVNLRADARALDLVDAGDAAGGQLRQPEVDGVAFLNGQRLGGLDEAPVKLDAAPVDGGIEDLAVPFGGAGVAQSGMRPHRSGGDNVETAALEHQLALGLILDPVNLTAILAPARLARPA